MSTRPQTKPSTVINNVSMASNITSSVTVLSNQTVISYAYLWTGTSPVGTVSVQGSNDFSQDAVGNILNAGTWNTLPLNLNGTVVTTIPISGNSDHGAVDVDANGLYAIRTIYTFGSGVGNMTATVVAKVS
jgi:hypothetical protein